MPQQSTYDALANLAADGNTSAITMPGLISNATVFLGTATFGGGTLKAQVSFDGGTTYLDHPSLTFTSGTANTKKGDYTIIGPKVRFNLNGATGPNLDVAVAADETRDGNILQFSFTEDADSAIFNLPRKADTLGWAAQGTWSSGTLTLKVSPDGGTTWYAVSSATANALKHITDNTSTMFKFTLSGSSTPDLTAYVVF